MRASSPFFPLYTRAPVGEERIVSLDEMTSLQPRTRSASTKPARPGLKPCLLEHEYERKGAWNLFAAFDIQTGEVIAQLHRRKRQVEMIALFEAIDKATPRTVKTIHLICDNISIHKGKLARQWLERHPRFTMHHTPVHCSWMNQVEQWFSILRRNPGYRNTPQHQNPEGVAGSQPRVEPREYPGFRNARSSRCSTLG